MIAVKRSFKREESATHTISRIKQLAVLSALTESYMLIEKVSSILYISFFKTTLATILYRHDVSEIPIPLRH